MADIRALAGQCIAYGAAAALVGTLSILPRYQPLPEGSALLRLSFTHPGRIVAECRERTADELAQLPPNMRVQTDCPRERSPVAAQVRLDGALLVDATFPPAGLHRDGASSGYRSLPVPAGAHTLAVAFNDDRRVAGFTHVREERITLRAGDVVLVDFAAERGGILIEGGTR